MQQRIIIVDFAHMVHTFYHSGFGGSVTVMENGVPVQKSTRIQYGCIRNIYNWSAHGNFPTAICFDRPTPARKQWFSEQFETMKVGTSKEYKGTREKMPQEMYEGVLDCERLLTQAGASCFAMPGYEADDLVFASLLCAKKQYPDCPIDIITNDADLLPLVDEQVSVFIRSKKGTYAVSKEIEKNKYIQVTPANYSEVIENLSAYKGFNLPYNTLLLHKLLRGDTSDNINGIKRRFCATKFNKMIETFKDWGVDFENTFRYGVPQTKILYRDTNEEYTGTLEELKNSPDKSKVYQKILNTKELDAILEVMSRYTDDDEEVLEHIRKMYWGMNLNQTYPNQQKDKCRMGIAVKELHGFNEFELQKAVKPLRINLIRA